MKPLITTIALLTFAMNSDASCKLNLKVKSAKAKTFYLESGEKLSKRTLDKLSPFCTMKIDVMTKAESKSLKIKELERKLNKLKG